MRVAELDMTNSSHQCPSGLMEHSFSTTRTCINPSMTAGCSSNIVNVVDIEYSAVCGKVIGYQIGHTNAFINAGIDSTYVDGVSLTHGSPRQHIWTFAVARDELSRFKVFHCPCINAGTSDVGTSTPPSFVGDDYFCDTGARSSASPGMFYGEDPLWDGAGCGSHSSCCDPESLPWFYKQLPQPTIDNIDLRVCRDEVPDGEDIAIEMIELYIQ